MARIRSIHPPIFTDEAFAGLSDAAQIFIVGIWTECDDQGIFEWKPLTLRMRLRPTKDGSVEALLSELLAANIVRRYEHEGRQLGAVRNFQRFQRPKKPKAVHPTTPEIRTYVASSAPSGELADDEAPPSSELSSQMEDGGGRMKVEEETTKQRPPQPEPRAKRASGNGGYAFEAATIKLNAADFERWAKAFPYLSLAAELEGMDPWAATKGKDWFQAVAGNLAKKNREAGERLAIDRQRTSSGGAPAQDPRL